MTGSVGWMPGPTPNLSVKDQIVQATERETVVRWRLVRENDRPLPETMEVLLPYELAEGESGALRLEIPLTNEANLSAVGPSEATWAYQASATIAPGGQGTCLEVAPVDAQMRNVRTLMFTGGLAPVTVCDEVPLPVVFTSPEGTEYELQASSHQPAEAPRDDEHGPFPASWSPIVPRVERSMPLFAEHPEQATAFPVREAHEQALERVSEYRELYEAHEDAFLSSTDISYTGGFEGHLGVQSEEEHDRTVAVLAPDGSIVYASIVKTEREDPVEDGTTYHVEDTEEARWKPPVPNATTLAPRQADVNASLDAARELTGQPLDAAMFGLWAKMPTGSASWMAETPTTLRTDGYSLVVWLEEKNPEEGPGGSLITTPYQVVLDGLPVLRAAGGHAHL
jgi:hypothetical protein